MMPHDLPHATGYAAPAAARPVVLLVEDDADIASLMAEMLEGLPCDMLTAPSGESALPLLSSHPVCLAIVDQTLPGMPGSDFVAQARSIRPGLQTIYISGAPIEAGTRDPVLLKPFRAAELSALVAAVLDRRAPV